MKAHLGVLLYFSALAVPALAAPAKPNVLVLLADDLGYSDLGCYGSEIRTPQLDALAKNGLRFTQAYNTARCWPSRAALLTGYYAQQVRRDTVPGIPSGSRGVRPAWAKLLPEMLRTAGYRSYHSGKWHVDGLPLQNGFERSYFLQDEGRYFNPRAHSEDDRKLPAVKPGKGYYSTTAIADHALRCLKEHAKDHPDSSFFQYVAFTAPHFPLHALPEDIARYRDVYRKGWDEVRAARWERIKELKLVVGNRSEPERDVGPPYHYPAALAKLGPGEVNRPLPWKELTAAQREFQAEKMAIHAAMIDRLDREIGRIVDQLRAMKALDDTLILFLSDNGASAEMMVRDDGHDPAAKPGSAATHLCLGPGWSTVANTPFRRHKTWVHEGGIATPFIVHWPKGIAGREELRRTPVHVVDFVPTVLELTGARHDKSAPPLPGHSLVSVFAADGDLKRDELWWAHEGNRALRVGDWKLVAAGAKAPWELYDLAMDRCETNNLAAKHPEKVRELEQRWNQRTEEFRALASKDLPAEKPVKELILPGESFLVAGRPAFVLLPPEGKRQKPQPWICYAPTLPGFPDQHEKWMHEKFLAAGIAVAGIDVGEAYGSPQGREGFTALYKELTSKRNFAAKPCLLGRSRGGLWVTSWAAANPEKVAGVAAIYPVFDFRTYPGLAKAAPAYNMTVKELEERIAEHNPIERVPLLAKAKIPAFIIHGDEDKVVPLKENSAAFVAHYKAQGAEKEVTLVVAKGQGHNYWEGFFRCQELIDFAIARARAGAEKK